MALIKCPECNAEVSDRADSCVNCGCPINKRVDVEISSPVLYSPVSRDAQIEVFAVNPPFWKKLTIPSIVVVLVIAAIVFFRENGHDLEGLKQQVTAMAKKMYKEEYNKDIIILEVGLSKISKGSYEYTGYIDASYNGVKKQLHITVYVNNNNVQLMIKAPTDPWVFDLW